MYIALWSTPVVLNMLDKWAWFDLKQHILFSAIMWPTDVFLMSQRNKITRNTHYRINSLQIVFDLSMGFDNNKKKLNISSLILWSVETPLGANSSVGTRKSYHTTNPKPKDAISSLYLCISLSHHHTHTNTCSLSLCEPGKKQQPHIWGTRSSHNHRFQTQFGFRDAKRAEQMEGEGEKWGCFQWFRNGVTCIT